jgi:hypothetical protein
MLLRANTPKSYCSGQVKNYREDFVTCVARKLYRLTVVDETWLIILNKAGSFNDAARRRVEAAAANPKYPLYTDVGLSVDSTSRQP